MKDIIKINSLEQPLKVYLEENIKTHMHLKDKEIDFIEGEDGRVYERESILYERKFNSFLLEVSYSSSKFYDLKLREIYAIEDGQNIEVLNISFYLNQVYNFYKQLIKNKTVQKYYRFNNEIRKKDIDFFTLFLNSSKFFRHVHLIWCNHSFKTKLLYMHDVFNLLSNKEGIYNFIFNTELILCFIDNLYFIHFLYFAFESGMEGKEINKEFNNIRIQRFINKKLEYGFIDSKNIIKKPDLIFFEECYKEYQNIKYK